MWGCICAFLFSSDLFESYGTSINTNGITHFYLYKLHQRFVLPLYYYLFTRTDTRSNCYCVYHDDGELYKPDLLCAERSNISALIKYIKSDGPIGNTHTRLLEFCVHKVLSVVQALLVSGRVLKMVHGGFRNWLKKVAHNDSHITAIGIAFRRDGSASLYALYII